ncbi:MAG: BrnA antitoxin family protein [Acidobacteriota bacterium]
MRKHVKSVARVRPLTAKQCREIAALAARPDSEIDYTDIPRLPEAVWKNAVKNPWYRPLKQQLTVRLDADVVGWLRARGRGYQTRMNALLRDAMLKELAKRGTSNRRS